MRWLIVGAGAVGQVLGAHARRGGAEVGFRVRDARRVQRPLRVIRLGLWRRPRPASFDAPVFDRDDEVAAFSPDLVVLTVPSDALAGPWLASLLASAPGARIVAMEPGAEDAKVISGAAPGRPLTRGIVAFIAYQSPLPNHPTTPTDPGIAYWAPQAAACPFEGPDAALVSATFRAGGLAATERRGMGRTAAYGAAVMALYVSSLRLAGWSFRDWRGSDSLALAGRAVREATVALADTGPAPWWIGAMTPRVMVAGVALAERIVPLPLEAYLAYHFTKVGAQSLGHVEHLVAHAECVGAGAEALRSLASALAAAPGRA